jgi:hypothetical protein
LETCHPLILWLQADDKDENDQKLVDKTSREREIALRKLRNVGPMFQLLADAMFDFMRMKNTPFPLAFKSKETFLAEESWKRAMIFVNLFRYVTGQPANKQWHKFGKENYRLNKVLFRRYLKLDHDIVRTGKNFANLRDKCAEPAKRKMTSDSLVDAFSPAKTVIRIESSDDD